MATAGTQPLFDVSVSTRSPGRNLPQRVGARLWLPMLALALMAFPAALVLGIVRASEIADGGSAVTIEQLRHVGTGVMFVGFAAVFMAISFAVARILGELRRGGGEVQEAARRPVETLRMPPTARLFLALMLAATMIVGAAVVLHFVFAADVTGSGASLADSEERFIVLEGVRRAGTALYLLAIGLGLATVVRVLRFQAVRMRRLPEEPARDA